MNSYQTDHMRLLWASIDAFNAKTPPGSPVTFTSGLDAKPMRSETIGEAYEDGCRAFVRVRHSAAPVPLAAIKRRENDSDA